MQNLLEIQNALRNAPDQQLMGLMQGANSSVPQWAVASEMNSRKEMRDEQTRQQGLGQPTVLEGLMGAAPAPTPQTNVAGMPQDVASGMAQSMAPKTDVNQNKGIATMASGGILKMQGGGDPAEKTYTFIYPEGMNKPSFDLEISDSGAYNSVVKAIRELGGTIIEKDTGRVMQSDTAKEIMQESSDIAEAEARVPKYVPSASDVYGKDSGRFTPENAAPENYGVSAGLPPAGGAMYSSPTGARGGNIDSSRLGLPTDEFSEVPLSAIPTPKGLATLAAAGDADMRDETPVGDTTSLTETQRRIKESDAERARAAFLESLTPNNAQGQPGGTVGGFRGLDAIFSRSPNSGELTPAQTARNQKILSNALRREEVARQRADIAEAGEIAQDAADTRKAYSVPLESDAVETVSAGEIKPNPFAVSKAPFNATSDEAAKKSVNQATLANNARDERVARVTSGEPGTELAETVGRIAPKADEPQQLRFINAILNRDAGEAVSKNDAQPEVFATDRVNPFAFNKAPETTKPEVFDALEDIRMQELIVNDSPDNQTPVDQILIDQVKKLGTPQEQMAAIKLASDKHMTAMKAEEAARVALAEAQKNDTGVYDAKKKLEAAQKETNRIERAAPWVLEGDFGIKRAFGPEISKLVVAQAADDLQAEAVADVAKVTTNENYPVSPVEVRKRLRAMEEKDAGADERFDLAETRLDAERAAGLSAGKNAFVAPSSADPTSNAALTAKLVGQMQKKDAPVSDDTRLNSYLNAAGQQGRAIGAAANSIGTDLKLPSYQAQLDGEFDKRVIEMRELADGIASGKYTGNGLKIAQDRIKYLNSVMGATGGAETFSEYLNDGAKKVVQSYVAPAAVDMADFVLGGGAQVALPEALGGGVDNTAATQDSLDILQKEIDGKPNISTKPSVLESDAILDAMITNDAQTKAGSAAKVDNSLGALITDGQTQAAAVPGQILTPELNDKLAAGLETVVQDRKKEISEDGALINKMWGESELQPKTNVESQIVNAEGLTAAEQLDADRAAGLTAGENAFVATTNQDAGGSGEGKSTGIATVNSMANRASDSPSSYEQKLLDILDKREKSADQDKWLGLAEMGMRLMASSNPNMLSAIGEAGLGASQTFLGNKRKAEAQEMDVLSKLSALEARKQIADDANRTRLEASRISASRGFAPKGGITEGQLLTSFDKQIKDLDDRIANFGMSDDSRSLNKVTELQRERAVIVEQRNKLTQQPTSIFSAAVDLSK